MLDFRDLSKFLYELNIARRHLNTYPEHHPLVSASAAKILQLIKPLLDVREELTIGAAKDFLMVEETLLDRANPLFQDLARRLFSFGTAAVTFRRGIEAKDLQTFIRILNEKPEEIRSSGGISRALSAAEITAVKVREIDYEAFRIQEEEVIRTGSKELIEAHEATLWERFVAGILDGREERTFFKELPDDVDPEAFARWLNEQIAGTAGLPDNSRYESAITSFLKDLDRHDLDRNRSEALNKFCAFVNGLNPVLRRQFMASTFHRFPYRPSAAEDLISQFSSRAILDAMEEINDRELSISPVIFSLIGKLAHTAGEASPSSLPTEPRPVTDLESRVRALFQEEDYDRFVPEDYNRILRSIITSEQISDEGLENLEELKSTLLSHCVETRLSSVVLEILKAVPAEEDARALGANLLAFKSYFLDMGDFAALTDLFRRIRDQQGIPSSLREDLLEKFTAEPFPREVLRGFSAWGKAKQNEIQELIRTVGRPFVEPLLDHLAQEAHMSRRRLLLDCLQSLGEMVREPAAARLRDSRWYFVRNLIVLLRGCCDATILPEIVRLSAHPNPKIRQEVLKTLLHFQDPRAKDILLQLLDHPEREQRLAGIQLAVGSRSQEVLNRLLHLLDQGSDFEMKAAVIRTLGEIGHSGALPLLEKILNSRSLLYRSAHQQLKRGILETIDSYPPEPALKFLDRFLLSASGELAALAGQKRRGLKGVNK